MRAQVGRELGSRGDGFEATARPGVATRWEGRVRWGRLGAFRAAPRRHAAGARFAHPWSGSPYRAASSRFSSASSSPISSFGMRAPNWA